MEVTVDAAKWMSDADGSYLLLRTPTARAAQDLCDEFKQGTEYRCRLTVKARSLDANAYMWVLIDRLADKLRLNKLDLYRETVRFIPGTSDIVCVQDKAAETLKRNWESKGLGWQAVAEPSKIKGCTNMCLYYGSSVFDTKQMSMLIDEIVSCCKENGIETMTPQELDKLKSRWGEAVPNGE